MDQEVFEGTCTLNKIMIGREFKYGERRASLLNASRSEQRPLAR